MCLPYHAGVAKCMLCMYVCVCMYVRAPIRQSWFIQASHYSMNIFNLDVIRLDDCNSPMLKVNQELSGLDGATTDFCFSFFDCL